MKSKTLESRNIVLLGDSIFDNASYVDKDQNVTAHLRRVVPENNREDVKAVAMDMWKAYETTTEEILPNALKST